MAEQARRLFLTCDPIPACRRWNLEFDKDEIHIRFFSEEFRIFRRDGKILDANGRAASFYTVLSLYDVLCRPGIPVLCGCFTPITSLNGIHGTHSVHESLNDRTASRFAGKTALLFAACQDFGGTPFGNGDVSFQIPVFDFFPLWFRFWDEDDEFPASMQFLWDQNALQFAHYETLWYISSELISRFLKYI